MTNSILRTFNFSFVKFCKYSVVNTNKKEKKI